MRLLIYFFAFLLCWNVSVAEDISLKDGRVFKDATVSDKGLDFIRVHHSEGIAKVSFRDLSEDLQKKYNMTEQAVQNRVAAQQQKNQAQKAREEESARKLRESLSDAEKSPRYMKGADISRLMVSVSDISPVEAEYAALVWNSGEARRVGLKDQADSFIEQAALFEPRLKDVRSRREKDGQKSERDQERLRKELADANRRLAQLQNQIVGLKGDLAQVRNEQNSRTVFVDPPVIYNPPRTPIIITPPIYPPRPPVFFPPRPPRPVYPVPIQDRRIPAFIPPNSTRGG